MRDNVVISVNGLSKKYQIGTHQKHKKSKLSIREKVMLPFNALKGIRASLSPNGENSIWALKDISFEVKHGERLGIIGRNGAGKTTLLKILSRLVYPTEGEAIIRGRVTSLLGVGTGFNASLTGRDNVYLNASLYGLKKAEVDQKFDSIVEYSGVKKFIDTPVKYYSSGMHMRLAFSVAAHLDPDILLLDEVLAVGDIAFQQKCLKTVEELTSGRRTIIFVSHSMGDVLRFCEKAIWLEEGKIIEYGDSKSVITSYSKIMLNLKASYYASSTKEKQGEKSEKIEAGAERTEWKSRHSKDAILDKKNEETEASLHPEAPGAELVGIEISDTSDKIKELFFRNEPINVTLKYRLLRDDIQIYPVIHLNKDAVHVFTSHPREAYSAMKNSVCIARISIPANMLNTGDYNFSVALVTPSRPKWRHVWLERVLSFKIVEEFNPERIFSGEYRGVIRPHFSWDFFSDQT